MITLKAKLKRRILTAFAVLAALVLLWLGFGSWLRWMIKLPGERDAQMLYTTLSPDGKTVARVGFKVLRSDAGVDTFITWVEVGSSGEVRGARVFTLFESLCVAPMWEDDASLKISYWGRVSTDAPPRAIWHGVKVKFYPLADYDEELFMKYYFRRSENRDRLRE